MQDHDDSSERSYKDKTNRKGCQPLEPVQLSYEDIDRRVTEDSSSEDSKMLENTAGPNAAVTEAGWTILQEWNEDSPTMNLVAQVYDKNIKQKDDKIGETSET